MDTKELEQIIENHKIEDWEAMGANLRFADLSDVNLICADLSGVKNVPYIPMICPEGE